MSEEIVIYEEDDIKITNIRAIIQDRTYSIGNITSVGASKSAPSGVIPGGLIIFGFILFMSGVVNPRENTTFLLIGIFLIIVGFFFNRSLKPTYILQISTAAGEIKALESNEQQRIQKISDALNEAMIKKG